MFSASVRMKISLNNDLIVISKQFIVYDVLHPAEFAAHYLQYGAWSDGSGSPYHVLLSLWDCGRAADSVPWQGKAVFQFCRI